MERNPYGTFRRGHKGMGGRRAACVGARAPDSLVRLKISEKVATRANTRHHQHNRHQITAISKRVT